jgi:hypothetical protein
MPKITGYSERGLVNALVEEIINSPDPKNLLNKILCNAMLIENKHSLCMFNTFEIVDFEIVVEHSLSDFGDPDVMIFLKRRQAGHQSDEKLIMFLEAKVCPFFASSPAVQTNQSMYLKNGSTILHELFLKACFSNLKLEEMTKGVRLYKNDERARKIGGDPVVLRMAEKIKDGWHPCFVALTTDTVAKASTQQKKHLGMKTAAQIYSISGEDPAPWTEIQPWQGPDDRNLLLDKSKFGLLPGYWHELTYILSWQDIFLTAKTENCRRIIKTMRYNRRKFDLPRIPFCEAEKEAAIIRDFGFTFQEKERLSQDMFTLRHPDVPGGLALFTGCVCEGFEGRELHLRPVPKRFDDCCGNLDKSFEKYPPIIRFSEMHPETGASLKDFLNLCKSELAAETANT